MFPAYGFALARQFAERVEVGGAGTLSDETLAIDMHLSAKSSGFQLKTLTARQFGLLTKQGDINSTTPLAKRIFKPTSEQEKQEAMAESFLAIPLFREIAARFKGQPLPKGQTLRNILEREFGIESKRVSDAERVLIDSARDTGVLITPPGGDTYISTARGTVALPEQPKDVPENKIEQVITSASVIPPSQLSAPPSPPKSPPVITGTALMTISIEDFSNVEGADFNEIWGAIGKLVKAKSKKLEENKKGESQVPPK